MEGTNKNECPRTRRLATWSATALTAVLLPAWLVSAFWYVGWVESSWSVRIGAGALFATWTNAEIYGVFPGFTALRVPDGFPFRWWWAAQVGSGSGRIAIPLWMPLLLPMLFSIMEWWRFARARRRARLHLCVQCGYDRTGLSANAPCPECGNDGERAPLSLQPEGLEENSQRLY